MKRKPMTLVGTLTELVDRAIKGMGGLDISPATPAGNRPALRGRLGTALTREPHCGISIGFDETERDDPAAGP